MGIALLRIVLVLGVTAPVGVARGDDAAASGERSAGPAAAPGRVSFNRQIRPILAENCFACHGPDARARKADLRLDQPPDAADGGGAASAAIVAGHPERSALIARIFSDDAAERMPPPATEKHLSDEQKALLRAWIAEGAAYEKHWSFIAPERPSPPALPDTGNELDAFIRARLAAAQLAPAPAVDRRTLIRRASLDLTGLPPTPEEVAQFAGDAAPDAYARLLDRLLASPRYGERMAQEWLDAARYGDTNGYHIDNERFMWRWRDWVIDAYNRNLSFDQFTIQQLAGDLLPGAGLEEKIASGFHRNHMINFEGGAIPEEYQSAYVVDRVNTTSTVWLGLTVSCAQCHDHKYDPITTQDYYRLYAIFNSVPEEGLDGKDGNSMPRIPAPLPAQRVRLETLTAERAALEAEMNAPRPELDAAQARWEQETGAALGRQWSVLEPFSASTSAGAVLEKQPDNSLFATGVIPAKDSYEIVAFTTESNIRAVRLEALGDPRTKGGGPGRFEHNNFVLSEIEVEVAPLAQPTKLERVKFAGALADHSQPQFHVSRALDGNLSTGWAVGPKAVPGGDRIAVFVAEQPFGAAGGSVLRIRLRHESQYAQHSIGRVRLALAGDAPASQGLRPSVLSEWHVLGPLAMPTGGNAAHAFSFEVEKAPGEPDLAQTFGDARQAWIARGELVDGVVHTLGSTPSAAHFLYRTIAAPTARKMLISIGSDDGVKLWLNGRLIHDNPAPRPAAPDQDMVTLDLPAGQSSLLMKVSNVGGPTGFYFERREDASFDPPLAVARCLEVPAAERSAGQQALLRASYREQGWPPWREMSAKLAAAQAAEAQVAMAVPTTMVMADAPDIRKTNVLMRGEYDQKGAEVTPGVPASLPPLPAGVKADRLALARWLVEPSNPLTARVAVNRLWQMVFGTGLVKTSNDFGVQGEWPSHPELLDWLATEYVSSGWDTKHMLRLMMMSQTYQQSSRATPESLARDAENRLLARGARFRLSAEAVRDSALFVSGLLVEKPGGPSVRPYQPPGLWEEMAIDPSGREFSAQVYKQDHGESLYRRTMYTFIKRSVPPPSLAVFDAPSREVCVVQRSRTNTPLQALVLMNDPTYVEAARVFAERILKSAATDARARVAGAFERVTARPPTDAESAVLIELYESQLARFRGDAKAVEGLLGVGEYVRDATLDAAELAAWTMVASTLLNLDEAITKG